MREWTVTYIGKARESVTVRAFSEGEAAEEAVKALGIELVPCCEIGHPPCAECQKVVRK